MRASALTLLLVLALTLTLVSSAAVDVGVGRNRQQKQPRGAVNLGPGSNQQQKQPRRSRAGQTPAQARDRVCSAVAYLRSQLDCATRSRGRLCQLLNMIYRRRNCGSN